MKRIERREEKFIFPYVEYSPENAGKEKLPLVIQLHGAGERGEGEEDLNLVDVHGFSKLLKEKDYKCTVVMPQCPKNTFWAARVESIIKFVEQLIEEYNADPDRVYLTGLSMGGFGTWFTAMARPDLFAAIAPVCGGGMPWNAKVLKMPVWTFHGLADALVSPAETTDMVDALKKTNPNVKCELYEGVGHNAWDYAFREETLAWILSQKKAEGFGGLQRVLIKPPPGTAVVMDIDQARGRVQPLRIINFGVFGDGHIFCPATLHDFIIFIGQSTIPDDAVLHDQFGVDNGFQGRLSSLSKKGAAPTVGRGGQGEMRVQTRFPAQRDMGLFTDRTAPWAGWAEPCPH